MCVTIQNLESFKYLYQTNTLARHTILICVLIIKDAKHSFLYLMAICFSSSGNYLGILIHQTLLKI